jgi:DNA-binding FadR family transcriptional regulator
LLFEAADNKMLLKLLDVFWLAYRKAAESIDLRNNELMQTYEDHRRIVEAVKSRNAKAAREALVDQHYAGLLRRLEVAERRLLDSVPRASPITEPGEVTGQT